MSAQLYISPELALPLDAVTAGLCFCGSVVYGATTHPCCEFWRPTVDAGRPCPACVESRRAAATTQRRERTRRRHPAAALPLERTSQ